MNLKWTAMQREQLPPRPSQRAVIDFAEEMQIANLNRLDILRPLWPQVDHAVGPFTPYSRASTTRAAGGRFHSAQEFCVSCKRTRVSIPG